MTLPPMRTSLCLSLAIAATWACASDSFTDNEVMVMAQAWSGSSQLPLCGRTGPDGEDLGSPDSRYCEWRTPSADAREKLSAIVEARATTVTWRRATSTAEDADRLTDSIRSALLARGLRERSCGAITNLTGESRGVRWEGDSLVVDVTRITPRTGPPRVQIVAVDVPSEMPGILCARLDAR